MFDLVLLGAFRGGRGRSRVHPVELTKTSDTSRKFIARWAKRGEIIVQDLRISCFVVIMSGPAVLDMTLE